MAISPDCVCRLGQRAFVLINKPCSTDDCADFGRMFHMDSKLLPDFINNTLSAAFFDIGEDVRQLCDLYISLIFL